MRINFLALITISVLLLGCEGIEDGSTKAFYGINEYDQKCFLSITNNGEIYFNVGRSLEDKDVFDYQTSITQELYKKIVEDVSFGRSENYGKVVVYKDMAKISADEDVLTLYYDGSSITSYSILFEHTEYRIGHYRCSHLKKYDFTREEVM